MTADKSKEAPAPADAIDAKARATSTAPTGNDEFVCPLARAVLNYRKRPSADYQPVPLDRDIDEIPDWVLGGG